MTLKYFNVVAQFPMIIVSRISGTYSFETLKHLKHKDFNVFFFKIQFLKTKKT